MTPSFICDIVYMVRYLRKVIIITLENVKGRRFVMKREYVSERQKQYYEEVLPKLSKEIQDLNLGMRANTCLVSAELTTSDSLKKAIENGTHIPMLNKEAKEVIASYFEIEI